jgi:hypothetical protein
VKNLKLLQLLESVLGKGKSTSGNNIAFFSPFTSHYKPKLEIDINTNHNGENPWHCWISDKKGRTISSLFKQMGLPKERFEQLAKIIESSRYRNTTETKTVTAITLPEHYAPLWIAKTTPDYRNVIGFFTSAILKDSRLVSGFNILYPKVESFIKYQLFTKEVELSDPQTMRNLSEIHPKEILKTTFKKAIDELTITDKGTAEVKNFISLKLTKPKVAENQPFLVPKKSVFNKIIGDNPFELEFSSFCESRFNDVVSFAKNTFGEVKLPNDKIVSTSIIDGLKEKYGQYLHSDPLGL